MAIADFNEALKIDPKNALTYYSLARIYYKEEEYDKSWEDIKKAQDLGSTIPPEFLDKLRKASGKKR
jgi:tetratricopeptide (TPR) repeat protein